MGKNHQFPYKCTLSFSTEKAPRYSMYFLMSNQTWDYHSPADMCLFVQQLRYNNTAQGIQNTCQKIFLTTILFMNKIHQSHSLHLSENLWNWYELLFIKKISQFSLKHTDMGFFPAKIFQDIQCIIIVNTDTHIKDSPAFEV